MTSNDDRAAPGDPFLALQDEAGGPELAIRDGMTVGRMFGDLLLADQPGVSRRHGEFRVADSVVAFAQAEVRNPARLNGEAIAPGCAVVIRPGDRLEFGTRAFTIISSRAPPAGHVAATATGPAAGTAPAPDAGRAHDARHAYEPERVFAPARAESAGELDGAAGAVEDPRQRKQTSYNEFEHDRRSATTSRPPFAEARGSALVALAAFGIAAAGALRAATLFDGAPAADRPRLWAIAALCAALPLAVGRELWANTLSLRGGNSVARGALAFLVLLLGLEIAIPDLLDEASGIFSRAQANGLAQACTGESIRSGPCAEIYGACGPRCRKYALPALIEAAGLDPSKLKAAQSAPVLSAGSFSAPVAPAPGPATGPSPLPHPDLARGGAGGRAPGGGPAESPSASASGVKTLAPTKKSSAARSLPSPNSLLRMLEKPQPEPRSVPKKLPAKSAPSSDFPDAPTASDPIERPEEE